MSRRSHLFGSACLALLLTGCIQRRLECLPIRGSSGEGKPAVAGVSLLGSLGMKALVLSGDKDKVALSPVSVSGQPFAEAVRAEVKKGSGHEWAVQLQAPTAAAVDEGDVILATFYLRAEKPLPDELVAQTAFVFEQAKSPYAKSATYDAQAGSEWRQVHLPFVAKQKFGPGEAQMIFRLGYEPETIDIGGLTVENYGKKVRLASLPTSPHWNAPRKAESAAPLAPVDGGPLAIEVDTGKVIGPISPYVYGINSQPVGALGATVRRMSGNRQTGYNWEINASNAGSDYRHISDDWPCSVLGYKNCDEPGAQFTNFATDNKRLGVETVATIPLVDYVTADKSNREVTEAEKAPSKRWNKSSMRKNGAYSTTPDLEDGVVYEDEFVSFLVKKLGRAEQGGIRFYSLDNEPALWSSTHPRIHSEHATYRELVTRTEAMASAITAIDPSALVLGGVSYGWSEFLSLQNAPDAKEINAQHGTFVDFFLASLKELEQKHRKRLVHVYDVHWYPEVKGTKRITEDDASAKTVDARLQAPRELWDPTYRGKSWIDDEWGKPIRLVPWLREKIDKRYPGTKLSMTEYNFGAGAHISGGLAQADVLGVLGREGVYLATYWGAGAGNGEMPAYIAAAFQLFRNYDGKKSAFGDTAVTAKPADLAKASVFAATDGKRPNILTVIVINKDQRARYTGKVTLLGTTKYARADAYLLDPSSPQVRRIDGQVEIKDNHLEYVLPPLSATLFVCEKR